ncbi:TonB-dependent receptor [Flavobacteriaceae bacterium]|nr:TonB-dependent receptor [Flavobacteriaceae bacterium]
MKTRLNAWLTLILALVVQVTLAQEKLITGIVSDDTGPLPGVSVFVKGTANAVETDFDGNYNISANVGDILVFSYIGMDAEERTVGQESVLNVVLASGNLLEEVVIVAYGTQSKGAVVGAVSQIDSSVLETQQNVSVGSALQGSVPGVTVISGGGQPGENPTIRVRGVGSINASADPLIIVDGVQFSGNLNAISPDEVESMTVLKDASSTSLYGSRAANGVIVITTKKGSFDQAPRISFRATAGLANIAVPLHDLESTNRFSELQWEAIRNGYLDNGDPLDTANQRAVDNFVSTMGYNPYDSSTPIGLDGKLVSQDLNWNTDWAENLLNDAALRQEYSMNVSGGSKQTTYMFSANYLSQEGSIQTSNFDRLSTRLNITTEIKDWLQIGLNSSYSTSGQNFPTQSGSSFQSPIQWIYSVSSYYPLFRRDSQGELIQDGFGDYIYDYGNTPGQTLNAQRPVLGGENAVGALYYYKQDNKRDNVSLNSFIKADITENLTWRTQATYQKYFFDSYSYVHNEYGYAANVGGRVSQNRDYTRSTNLINQLTFSDTFAENHNVKVDLIQEAFAEELSTLGAQGTGFLPNVDVLNGATTPEGVSGYTAEQRLSSYLGRIQYNYGKKYYLEGSYRRDGSSKFAEDVRWGGFFSVGGSWIITEDFFQDSEAISNLKVRASYGELGNNAGIGYFPYLSLYETGWNELDNTGVILGSVADPLLTWEKTAQTNIGVDFGFFNDRLTGSIDWFKKKSLDLIYDKPLPISTGNSSIKTNVGSISNTGWELLLTSVNVESENVYWSSSLNLSSVKNKVDELSQEFFITGSKRWEVGRSLYDFWIRDYAGVDPSNGDALWFKDILDAEGNPTGERDVTNSYADATRYYQDKTSLPSIQGGFSNFVKVKNFDLNFLFNFSLGAYVYDSTYAGLMDYTSVGYASHPDAANRWTTPGDITDVPRLTTGQNDATSQSNRFLFKNDYLRLKSLNFGYNIASEGLSNAGFSNARIYFQGDNLFTVQSHQGIDPEQSLAGTTNSRSYPQRIYSFGLTFDF